VVVAPISMKGDLQICNHAIGQPVPRFARFTRSANEAKRNPALKSDPDAKLCFSKVADSLGQENGKPTAAHR